MNVDPPPVLLALEAGCKQEPLPGALLSITGSLFSTTAINITAPSPSNSTTASTSSSANQPSTTTTIAVSVSLGGLFLAAAALFTLYFLRQRRYAREDANLLLAHQRSTPGPGYQYYGKDPSGPPSSAAAAHHPGFALQPAPPHYTVDYKSPSPASTTITQPQQPEADAGDYDSNAEYYDRLEGRNRGRPLAQHPVRLTSSPTNVTTNDAADALPTHPAYIPRTVTPGALGGRPSRSASVSGSRESGRQQQRSYAMEVYLHDNNSNSGREEQQHPASPRSLELRLGSFDDDRNTHRHQKRMSPTPPISLSNKTNSRRHQQQRRASLSPPPQQPPPQVPPPQVLAPPDRAITRTPAQTSISALLLPPVPRIRLGGKKQPGREGLGEVAAAAPVPLDKNMGISGPLAFPDSRFTVRPGTAQGDRIVEQTVDRGRRRGDTIEVPIGSGKSYLYG